MTRREYTAQVLENLRRVTRKEREAIEAEIDAHMEDHICDLLDLGYSPELAEERTMSFMGDPAEVGRELNEQYPLGWLILGRGVMVLTLLLALFLARPLLERTPAAWESIKLRCAPKMVLDISQVREDFEPLGLDAWDTDMEVAIQDVHFRVYQVAYDTEAEGGGNVRMAVACWRTNPFQEELDWLEGYALEVWVDGEAEGHSMQHETGGVSLYGVWAEPGQTLTMTWGIYGESGTISFTLPEVEP